MAKFKKQNIKCPKCGKDIEIEIWDKLEMPYDIEQKNKVMQNVFFKAYCKDCKILFPIAYRSSYNDLEQKYLIWLVPRLTQPEWKDIREYNERLKKDNILRLAQGGYRYRIVRSDTELREKILIFEEGLDDRFIETMKLVYLPMLKEKVAKDRKIIGFFFDKKPNDGYRWVLLLEGAPEPLVLNVNMDIYEEMKEKLADVADEFTPEGLTQINPIWARDVMQAYSEKTKAEEKKDVQQN